MSQQQIIALVVTAIGVGSFLVVFCILFANFRKFSVNEIRSGKRDIELIEEYFHNNKPKVIARKKIIRIVRNVLFILFLVLVFISISFTLISRFTDKLPVGTKTVMVVATDSMSEKNPDNFYLTNRNNQFQQYSIIILEKVDPDDLEKYDVIAFKTPTVTLIHRIVGIETSTGGTKYVTCGDKYSYITKTDQHKPSQNDVIGRYTGIEIPFLGALVLFLQAPSGIITVIALLLCLLMFDSNSGQISKEQKLRTDFLLNILDVQHLTDKSQLSVDFVENIYLDKVAYSFNSEGLVSKDVAREVLTSHYRQLPPDFDLPAAVEQQPNSDQSVAVEQAEPVTEPTSDEQGEEQSTDEPTNTDE